MNKNRYSTLKAGSTLFLCLLIACAACKKNVPASKTKGPPDPDSVPVVVPPPEHLREYFISPALTDSAIDNHNDAHFASVIENGKLKNTLFLFLPGSYRNPSNSNAMTRKAASLGFHSIGLMYSNTRTINPLCADNDDVTCHRRARLEVIDGVDRHPAVRVNRSNSIINRLQKLLVHLAKTHPGQKWDQFLVNGEINWSRIIVAGHSQGGGCAGVIGKYYPVKKVIMLSMIDYMTNGSIPDWELMPVNTERFYFLTHVSDELLPYHYQQAVWKEMGVITPGGPVNINSLAAPYGRARALITTIEPIVPASLIDKYHNCTAVDAYIPKKPSGETIFDEAWEYLLTD